MNGIFISYRRDDSAGHSGRIHDRLTAHFGEDRVFRDVEDIGVGDDFVDVIHDAVGKCGVLLVVIGPSWVEIKGAEGRRRLDSPNDVVRLEVASALRRKDIRVIPVLVNGATMPKASELPEDLQPLSTRNALEVRDTRFDDDVGQLIKTIGGARARRLRRLALGAGLVALPAAAALIVFLVVSSAPAKILADLSLYEGGGELLADDSLEIVQVVFPEDSGPAGPPPEIENRAAEPWNLYTVDYKYQRLAEDQVSITAALPYRELLARGGVVMGGGAYIDWEWPRLAVKVVNNSEQTIVLDQIELEVKRSDIDTEPIVMIREMLQYWTTFGVVNYGWGAAASPELAITIVEEGACADTTWRDLPLSPLPFDDGESFNHPYDGVTGEAAPGAPGTETRFNVQEYVPQELAGAELACLFGTMEYGNDRGEPRDFQFKTRIRLRGPIVAAAMRISAEYVIYLEAGKSGYVKTREIALEVPPGKAEYFLIRIATDKSAQFDLAVALKAVGGQPIPVDDVTLDVLTPVYDPLNRRDPSTRR